MLIVRLSCRLGEGHNEEFNTDATVQQSADTTLSCVLTHCNPRDYLHALST